MNGRPPLSKSCAVVRKAANIGSIGPRSLVPLGRRVGLTVAGRYFFPHRYEVLARVPARDAPRPPLLGEPPTSPSLASPCLCNPAYEHPVLDHVRPPPGEVGR